MKRTILAALVAAAGLLVLPGCKPPATPPSVDVGQSPDSPNEVLLVAVSPDGTHLWRTMAETSSGWRYVFFASTGTQEQRRQHTGKTTATRDEFVPTARPELP